MRLALDDPDRIERLMVVDIAPAPSGSDHDDLIDVLLALPVSEMTRRAQAGRGSGCSHSGTGPARVSVAEPEEQ